MRLRQVTWPSAVRDADKDAADTAPRYSDAAGVEHHPQVTDFLPRRYRTIASAALAGVAVTALVVGLDWCGTSWATRLGAYDAVPLASGVADGLAAWLSASLLLLTAATCLLIYSLRRHRIDDFRGRYRVWLAAAIACVVLSADSVAPIHELLAVVATQLTQHGALRDHAAWWLALAGLPLAWISLRILMDARESGLAAVALVASFTCYALSLVSYLVVLADRKPGGRSARDGRCEIAWQLDAPDRRRFVWPLCRARRARIDHQRTSAAAPPES